MTLCGQMNLCTEGREKRRKKHFLNKIGPETSETESLSKQDFNVLFRTKLKWSVPF